MYMYVPTCLVLEGLNSLQNTFLSQDGDVNILSTDYIDLY